MDGGFDFEELAKANNIPQLSEVSSNGNAGMLNRVGRGIHMFLDARRRHGELARLLPPPHRRRRTPPCSCGAWSLMNPR